MRSYHIISYKKSPEDCIYTASRDKLLKRWKPQRTNNTMQLQHTMDVHEMHLT